MSTVIATANALKWWVMIHLLACVLSLVTLSETDTKLIWAASFGGVNENVSSSILSSTFQFEIAIVNCGAPLTFLLVITNRQGSACVPSSIQIWKSVS